MSSAIKPRSDDLPNIAAIRSQAQNQGCDCQDESCSLDEDQADRKNVNIEENILLSISDTINDMAETLKKAKGKKAKLAAST